jgi:SAM-dependent methyltransferase
MKLARKIQKLFDPDVIDSTREHLRRVLHPIDATRLQRELENDESWQALRRKYPRDLKPIHRWADSAFWIQRNVERAQDLALDRPPPRRILDLGCGPGYFLFVARKLGHDATGLDLDEQPIFRDTLSLLGVERTVHRIGPRQGLPAPEKKFDLITSFLTCFHRIEREPDGDWRTWSPTQWQYFIDDVRANQLKPSGLLLLEFHPQKNGELYSADVRELFLKNQARLFRSRVFINAEA